MNPGSPPKSALRIQFEAALRRRHYSPRTERSYVGWVKRFARFQAGRRLEELGTREVVEFLTHLAVERHVSASTQRQAHSALLFLYREVLERDLDGLDAAVRARRPRVLPVVLTRDEVRAVLAEMNGTHRLIATLLYGGGLRLIECLRLRVKDVDFGRHQLVIRQGKGRKDRFTTFPNSTRSVIREQGVAGDGSSPGKVDTG